MQSTHGFMAIHMVDQVGGCGTTCPPPPLLAPLTLCDLGQVVGHQRIHGDVRVDGDRDAEHKIRRLCEEALR